MTNASPKAARNVVFRYPSTLWRTISRRRAQDLPPSRDDVSDIVNGASLVRKLDVASQTVPSGATRGSEPLSPTRGASASTSRGRDQLVCVPSLCASADEP